MSKHLPTVIGLTLVLSLGALTLAIVEVWDFTSDDAFITFRYSRNLVRGLGPTFNGEAPPRAEGYSSFLWMLLAAVLHLLASEPVAAAKAMCVGFTALTVGVCTCIAWSLCEEAAAAERALAASLATAMFATYPLTAVHAVSGMDTALAAFLLSVLAWLATRRQGGASGSVPWCALLVGLARPELNLAAITVLVGVLTGLEPEARRRFLKRCVLSYVVPGAAYFLWRLCYYQSLLPLPFYMKAATLAPQGLRPLLLFGAEVAACFGLLMGVSVVNLNTKSVRLIAVVAVMALYLAHPKHVMGYGHRFFHPLVPLIAAVSARGTVFVLPAVRGRFGPRRATIAYVLLLVIGLVTALSRYPFVWADFRQYARGMRNAHIRLGKLLAGHSGGENAILVIGDAGAVPYYSGWETVDSTGLNDPHIAKTGDHSAGYVLPRNPSLVVLQSRRPDVFLPHLSWEQELLDECARRGMAKVATLEFRPGFYLWLMAHPTTPIAKSLKIELRSP